ncbi:MAG TPA: ATP-grasp domain-containing protein [Acidimicrobiia bacterium]|jgi:carbamoyl-phosphate synthase large subunit
MTRVLVTGAGGAAGVAVIRALVADGIETVAADPDPLAAGCHLSAEHVALPYATDDDFAGAVVRAAAASRVDAVICTVAEEMPALVTVVADLEAVGAATWLPPLDAVLTCIDKQRFATAVAAAGLPAPTTRSGSADGVPGPWIVKPRFGRGSRSVCAVDDAADLAEAIRRTPDAIVQTRCTGREFTVDVLSDRSGSVVGLVPRWRLETKAGISTKGETFSDERVTALVRATIAALGLLGACNVQGFVDDDRDAVDLLEVNPRFSGGLPLALAAGADLVGEFLRGTLGLPIRPERLTHRDGVVMTRHLTEVFLEPSPVAS